MTRQNTNTHQKNRAVGYVRRSTDRQEQSIGDQKKALEAYAAEHGLRLVKFYIDGVVTKYLIDSHNPIGYAQVLEEWTDDSLTKTYIIGDDVIGEADSGGTVKYHLHDGHGSVRHHSDSSGALVSYSYTGGTCDTFSYDAYGHRIDPLKDTQNEGLFYTGEQWDNSAQSYYLRARYYNPLNGRFNRMDPFAGNTQDPQSLHKYAYVHNNPVNATDPSGREISLTGMVVVTGIISIITGGILIGMGMKIKNDVVRDIGIAFLTMGLALVGAASLMAGGLLLLSAAEIIATAIIIFGATLLITIAGGMVSEYSDKVVTVGTFKRFLEFYPMGNDRKIPPKGILIFREGYGDFTKAGVEIPNFVFSPNPPYMTNDTVYAYECKDPDTGIDFVIKKYEIDDGGNLVEKYNMRKSLQSVVEVDKSLPEGWTVIE